MKRDVTGRLGDRVLVSRILLVAVFGLAWAIVAMLSFLIVPLGEGSDEIGHLEHAWFKFRYPDKKFEVERSYTEPGFAPVLQGHQPPLYYWLGAQVFKLFVEPEQAGPFVDYLAEVRYSSEGLFFGGISRCSFRQPELLFGSEQGNIRIAVHCFRLLGSLFLILSAVAAYLLGREFFPRWGFGGIACALLYLSFPSSVWRSIFITNDNLVAMWGAWVAYWAVMVSRRTGVSYWVFLFLAILGSGLGMLSKYTALPLFPSVCLAVLLNCNLSWSKRLLSLLSAMVLFGAIVGPQLVQNLHDYGDLFTGHLMSRLAPFLFIPSSFKEIALNPHFLPLVAERVWVEFHSVVQRSSHFPFALVSVWWVCFIGGLTGLFLSLFSKVTSQEARRGVIVLASLVLLQVAALLSFASKFPLPHGRYLHPALLALVVLILIGWGLWIRLLCRGTGLLLAKCGAAKELSVKFPSVDNSIMFMGTALFFVFAQGLAFSFLLLKYRGCAFVPGHNVGGGVQVVPIDLDGDGVDEIEFFKRYDNRSYFAQEKSSGQWVMRPNWTRSFGLSPDNKAAFDFDGNGREEPISWRPSSRNLYIVPAEQIIEHQSALGQYPEWAVRFLEVPVPEATDFIMGCTDEGSREPKLYFYRKENNLFLAYNVLEFSPGQVALSPPTELVPGAPFDQPLVVYSRKQCAIGGWDRKSKRVFFRSLAASEPVDSLEVPQLDGLIAADLNRDGDSELVGWKNKSKCLYFSSLSDIGERGVKDSSQGMQCAKGIPIMTEHHQVVFLRTLGGPAIGIFSNVSGELRILNIEQKETGEWSVQDKSARFEPGW